MNARRKNKMVWAQIPAKVEMLDHTIKSYKMAHQLSLPIEFHDLEQEEQFQEIRFAAKGDNQITMSNETMQLLLSRNKRTNLDGPKSTYV